ncbi:type 4a pilus biogenesis protein PilO [Propionivibrio limicola]|uniref:type 4a pilus biogenesis protein PilO n=1 Tax=Propionivibrio limicola TaxID=167645 RepID=UPI001291B35A|nr:type 4a pilus biogenesis protein PilO [Propionivibrio limicola]
MSGAEKVSFDIKSILDEFQGLNAKDVGAWPAIPRFAALVFVLILVLLAGWWFVWSDQLSELGAREQEEVKLREEFVAKKTQAVNLDLYTQQLAEIDRSFGALLKQLPNKAEVESLLVEINQSGMGRGLQFELFKPGQETIKEFYAELPINVRLSGGYHDFGAFAADIGALSRIVTMNNVSIAPNQQAKDGSLVLDAVAKTFRYLDEEEVAARKRAEKAAKASKGKK